MTALRLSTSAVEETRALGSALADLVEPGDIIVLNGELGAGKTALTQGFAEGLGVTEQVVSPTFTIARAYRGRLALNHLDVYRLEHLQEAVDLGLAELTDDDSVTLIEWGEVILAALPPDHLEVRLTYGPGDDDRVVEVVAVGERWQQRERVLVEALTSWSAAGP